MPNESQFIRPDWPAPTCVNSASSTRLGGVSQPPFDSFNLATHVGDDIAAVESNRDRLVKQLNLPAKPVWLTQVHSDHVVQLPCNTGVEADAAYSNQPGQVCVVMTADCLPVLFTNKPGTEVAAAHAGWRGLVNGVLENTLQQFQSAPADILVWLGPAIGPAAFEVGDEVRQAFLKSHSQTEQAFTAGKGDKWFADIYALAQIRLQAVGVTHIYGGGFCTYTDRERFYSFRRDGQTGRMASLIWIN
ncbi:MAG: peptidoglycan editing factor PgeF [Gammaproteobacteria bacterium]|nr:peptidoglycan editing factor PgeF [Gammaproteobacteria bacterium]